jgi:E3 ubiquitin-protein ligase NEDD4
LDVVGPNLYSMIVVTVFIRPFHRENDITDILEEDFTVTEDHFGELRTVELSSGGADIPVTESNKMEYVEAVVEYRISKRVEEQFEAFREGFLELIPSELITVFDERELELLIGGMSEIDMYVMLVTSFLPR